jgi:hypothetical protein
MIISMIMGSMIMGSMIMGSMIMDIYTYKVG